MSVKRTFEYSVFDSDDRLHRGTVKARSFKKALQKTEDRLEKAFKGKTAYNINLECLK